MREVSDKGVGRGVYISAALLITCSIDVWGRRVSDISGDIRKQKTPIRI